MELSAGTLLGHHEILRSLGAGGMGQVYLALDRRLDRRVAIKVLPEEVAADADRLKRFRREAKAVAALNHPNIVTLYSVEQVDAIHFLTMELVDGKTLEHLIPPGGMSLEHFLEIAIPLTDALGAAHAKGITHRDLKPGNVMVTCDGRVKVLDFGLAKVTADPSGQDASQLATQSATRHGMVMGTLPYMSPEQVTGKPVDHRSDLFSMGIVFYEMLVGTRPFQAESAVELMSSILRDDPPRIETLRLELPTRLSDSVARCLEKDAGSRWEQVSELRDALCAVEGAVSRPAPATPGVPKKERGPSVAVMDFTNATRDSAADWLCTGITDSIIIDLKKMTALSVTPRERLSRAMAGSAAGPRDETTLRELGSRLGIDWIVWGMFQKLGERIRITACLLDVSEGKPVDPLITDGDMGDIFQLQDWIVAGLQRTLQVESAPQDRDGGAPLPRPGVKAYECYATAKQLLADMDRKDLLGAQNLFEQAIQIDPEYALGHAGLGQLHCLKFIAGTDPEDLELAVRSLRRAIELDPELGEPQLWLCYALFREGLLQEAYDRGRRAVELEPETPMTHYFLGCACWAQAAGEYKRFRWAESIGYFRKANALAPKYTAAFQIRGYVHLFMGEYDHAEEALVWAAELEASRDYELAHFVGANSLLGKLRLRQGNVEDAKRCYLRSLEVLDGVDHVYTTACVALTLSNQGELALRERRQDEAVSLFERACDELEKNPKSLGVGWILVRARIGQARAFHRLGMRRERDASWRLATELFRDRDAFNFSAIWEGNDAEIHLLQAIYHAELRHSDRALASLREAIRCGWSDRQALITDPALESIRGEPAFSEIFNSAAPPRSRLG